MINYSIDYNYATYCEILFPCNKVSTYYHSWDTIAVLVFSIKWYVNILEIFLKQWHLAEKIWLKIVYNDHDRDINSLDNTLILHTI